MYILSEDDPNEAIISNVTRFSFLQVARGSIRDAIQIMNVHMTMRSEEDLDLLMEYRFSNESGDQDENIIIFYI